MGTVHAKEPVREQKQSGVEDHSPKMQISGVKARVDRVHIEGIARTKEDVVSENIKDMFKAQDFQDVIMRAYRVRNKLQSLGCFQSVLIHIDVSSGPKATPDGLDVTFRVKELKRVIGGVNTMVGNNEGSVVFGMRLPNLFGRGEKLQTEYSYGSKKTNGFHATLTKPLRGNANAVFATSLFQQAAEWPPSGYREVNRGLLFDLAFDSAPQVHHNLQWEAVWRELSCLSKGTAFAVREHAGHSLKSSIRHILSVDRRDAPIFPSQGAYFRLVQEFAGIGGDIGFFKNEMQLQGNVPLPGDLVIQGSLHGGLLKRLRNDKTFSLCDHFFLGGPMSLRGFSSRGVGPHSDGCALGAEVYWAGALHLYAPLPFRPGEGGFGDFFKTHIFVNAGNIGNYRFTDDFHQNLNILLHNLRLAYGIGICLRLGQVARFELNYCVPVSIQKGDQVNAGLQFGIGVSYL